MKKIFTLIASALVALSANAALTDVANFTVAQTSPVDGSEIAGTNCTVQLHTSDVAANKDDATIFGASLNGDGKYVQIDLPEALQKGDIVYFSFFMNSNPTADNADGISVANVKADVEGYKELAKFYAQIADKKSVVAGGYIAAGGEKRFIVTKLNSTTLFQAVKVVRGYSNVIDFTNPAINTKATAEANILDAKNMTITDTADGTTGAAVAEWKNVAGQTASFSFAAAPVSISYKNSSVKTFAKTRTTGFQFNGTGQIIRITCNAGDKVTITPASYSKAGSCTVIGGDIESFTIPIASTDPVVIKASGSGLTLTETGAFMIEKIVIGETTAVEAVAESKAEAKAAPVKVIGKNGIQIGNYNIAGQRVK